MLDAELRGVLLTVFFDHRNNAGGWVPTSEINVNDGAASRQEVASVCQQLAHAALIDWQPLTGADEGVIIGMAHITAHGIDVVVGAREPSIEIKFPKPATTPERASLHADAMVLLGKIAHATEGSDVPVVLEDIDELEMDEARVKSAFRSLKGMGLIEADFSIFYAARVSSEGHRALSSLAAAQLEPAGAVPVAQVAPAPAEKPVEMFTLKPTAFGMSVDLKEVARRLWRYWAAYRARRKATQ